MIRGRVGIGLKSSSRLDLVQVRLSARAVKKGAKGRT